MTPRRLAALRAMAAQNASPEERDIAIAKLKALEDQPVGRKTVEQRPDGFVHISAGLWMRAAHPHGATRETLRHMTISELMELFDATVAARATGGPLQRKEP